MRPWAIGYMDLMRQVMVLILFFLSSLMGAFAQSDKTTVPSPDTTELAKAKTMEREALDQKDSLALAKAYYHFGKTYSKGGQRDKSEEYFLKSLRILERRGDSFELGKLYIWLGDTETRELRWTRVYQAKGVFERIGSKEGLMSVYGVLGRLYLYKGDFAASLENLKKGEELAITLKDSLGMAEISLFIGQTLATRDQYGALAYIDRAVELLKKLGHHNTLVLAYVESAIVYLDMDQYDMAWTKLAEAEKQYAAISAPRVSVYRNLQNALRQYYKKTGNYKAAHNHLHQFMQVENKLKGVQRDSIVRRLRVEYETEKKDTLLAAQQN